MGGKDAFPQRSNKSILCCCVLCCEEYGIFRDEMLHKQNLTRNQQAKLQARVPVQRSTPALLQSTSADFRERILHKLAKNDPVTLRKTGGFSCSTAKIHPLSLLETHRESVFTAFGGQEKNTRKYTGRVKSAMGCALCGEWKMCVRGLPENETSPDPATKCRQGTSLSEPCV